MAPGRKKFVVVGDEKCGKTAFIQTFAGMPFPDTHSTTVSDSYFCPPIPGAPHVEIVDTSGSEEFDRLRPYSYDGVNIWLVCFSIGSVQSLTNVIERWVPECRYFSPTIPIILIGCKSDIRDDPHALEEVAKAGDLAVSLEMARQVAKQVDAFKYVECSARTGYHISDMFDENVDDGEVEYIDDDEYGAEGEQDENQPEEIPSPDTPMDERSMSRASRASAITSPYRSSVASPSRMAAGSPLASKTPNHDNTPIVSPSKDIASEDELAAISMNRSSVSVQSQVQKHEVAQKLAAPSSRGPGGVRASAVRRKLSESSVSSVDSSSIASVSVASPEPTSIEDALSHRSMTKNSSLSLSRAGMDSTLPVITESENTKSSTYATAESQPQTSTDETSYELPPLPPTKSESGPSSDSDEKPKAAAIEMKLETTELTALPIPAPENISPPAIGAGDRAASRQVTDFLVAQDQSLGVTPTPSNRQQQQPAAVQPMSDYGKGDKESEPRFDRKEERRPRKPPAHEEEGGGCKCTIL
ncbi:GTP-binding protein Rho1 [Blyttiomyces sp. JEL0837]|nr:GTP-binding protein Rho1 [Blyttiomyces sp. JEL0837]